MSFETSILCMKIIIITCTILTFFFLYMAGDVVRKKREKKKKEKEESHMSDDRPKVILFPALSDAIEGQMKKSKFSYFNYDDVESFLTKKGAVNIGNGLVNPINFMFFKGITAVFTAIAFSALDFGIWGSIIGGVVAFFVWDYLIVSNNNSDNKDMLPDISRANETIKMYGMANVYLTDAIYECYRFAENTRFKKAMLELYSEINITHNMEDSLEHFRAKFDNDYIDNFARSLEQIYDSGFSEALMEDMSKDMLELQKEMNFNYAQGMKRKWAIWTLLLLVTALALCLWGMIDDFDIQDFLN